MFKSNEEYQLSSECAEPSVRPAMSSTLSDHAFRPNLSNDSVFKVTDCYGLITLQVGSKNAQEEER